MKKTLCLLTLLLLSSLGIQASGIGKIVVSNEDGKRLYYNFTEDKTAVMVAQPKGKLNGKIVIPETIEYNGQSYPVVGIEDRALYMNSGVTEVYLPHNMRSIGSEAFRECESLTYIYIPDELTCIGDRAFEESGISTFSFGANLSELGEAVFFNCAHLKQIHLPDHAINIGRYLFEGSGLEEVTIGSGLTRIPDGTFELCKNLKSINIPDNILSIGSSAFSRTGLESLTIGAGVSAIDKSSFANCSQLKTISIEGNGNTVIGDGAFSNNRDNLTTVMLGEGVRTVGKSAFQTCRALTKVEMNGVKSIGGVAFQDCPALVDISMSNVEEIGSSAFYGTKGMAVLDLSKVVSIGERAFEGWDKLTQLDLSNTETIGKDAFRGCNSITNLTFTSKLQSMGVISSPLIRRIYADNIQTLMRVAVCSDQPIDYYADGTLLTTIEIPEGITTMPTYTLANCTATVISLPSTLEKIEGYALYGFAAEKIYSYAVEPPSIERLYYTETPILFVPFGSLAKYENHEKWKNMPSIIEMPNPNDEQYDVVVVSEAGGLRLALSELETTKVKNLKIVGLLDATDIALLRAQEGRLSELEGLDLSEVTLVSDDEPYLTLTGDDGSGTFRSAVDVYYISDERKTTTSVGFHSTTYYHYDDRLPMAFCKLPLRRVVLPNGFTEIGSGMFLGCTALAEVVAPSTLAAIGSSAFSACPSLTTIPDISHVSKMDEQAFDGCTALQALSESGQLDISSLDSIPARAFNGCTNIKTFVFSPSLSFIGESALSGSGLTEISLPATITNIGKNVFQSCCSLRSVQWSASVSEIGDDCFVGCVRLADVQLPETLFKIGRRAFSGCSMLENISLPEQLCRIGYNAFKGTPWYAAQETVNGIKYAGNVAMECTQQDNLVFKEGTTGIADGFNGNSGVDSSSSSAMKKFPAAISLPSSLRYIGSSAFNLTLLTQVTIPEQVEEIGDYAFQLTKITNVNLPPSIKRIGHRAFFRTELETVSVPESVEAFGNAAFGCNTSLISVEYQARKAISEKEWGYSWDGAFVGCTALERVTLGDAVEVVPHAAFKDCKGLLKVTTGSVLREIHEEAFFSCSSLASIVLPERITSIGYQAFDGCTSLSKLSLPEGLKVIGSLAFSHTGITEIELPATLESFGGSGAYNDDFKYYDNGAFYDCNLVSVVSHIADPYEIGRSAFSEATYQNAKLNVPAGTLSLYQATPAWNRFANIVETDDGSAVKSLASDAVIPSAYYKLNGSKTSGQCGLNIVRYSDGTVKKVIMK